MATKDDYVGLPVLLERYLQLNQIPHEHHSDNNARVETVYFILQIKILFNLWYRDDAETVIKWLWCFRNGVKTRQGKAREKEGGTCRCWFPWQRRNRCDAYTQFRSAVYAFNNPSLITGLPRFLEYARNSSLLTSFRRLPLVVSCWHLFLTPRDNVYTYRQVFKPSNDTLFALSCF